MSLLGGAAAEDEGMALRKRKAEEAGVMDESCEICGALNPDCSGTHSTNSYDHESEDGICLTERGPVFRGVPLTERKRSPNPSPWERWIYYGNYVDMSHERIELLEELTKQDPAMTIYVCTVTPEMVVRGKCIMRFSHEYSQQYLLQHLHQPIQVPVMNEEHNTEHEVRFAIDEDGCVILTTNWRKVVRDTSMSEGQMAVFCFDFDHDGLFVSFTCGLPMKRSAVASPLQV